MVEKWKDKEILIPSSMEFKILGEDTVCLNLWDKPYKVMSYIDSIGCTGCQLGLPQWKQLIDSCAMLQFDVSFLFIVHSSDYPMFEAMLTDNQFHYPIG